MTDVFSVRELKREIIDFIVSNNITKLAIESSLIILKNGVIQEEREK